MNGPLIADLIVSIHFGYVLFVVGGLFVIVLGGALRWRFTMALCPEFLVQGNSPGNDPDRCF
jgi:hypothetical protein